MSRCVRLQHHLRVRLLDDDERLDADAEVAVFVVAGLVAEHHARVEARVVRVGAVRDAGRAFVHVEIHADAVPGAVQVIKAAVPQWPPCDRVQHVAFQQSRKDGHGERDMAFHDSRKALLFLGTVARESEGEREKVTRQARQ